MTPERWVVLAVAPARTPWFSAVAQWAHTGALPVEYVKCLSADELHVRLASGRPASAVLLDARTPGADRDLLAAASAAGVTTIVVTHEDEPRRWRELGAHVTVRDVLEPSTLLDLLGAAPRVARVDDVRLVEPAGPVDDRPATWHGRVAVVCGPGGTGASTVAMALAQGLPDDGETGPTGDDTASVVLADLSRHAELGMLHDAVDVVPAVEELVEAHRFGAPSVDDVRRLTFHVPDRGYALLLGLRRATAWSAVPPQAFVTAFDGLRRAFRTVVCDVDADFEGEADTGSADVEDRNTMARTAAATAEVVYAVGVPGTKGVHSLVRVVDDLVRFGVDPVKIQPVVNRAPRSPRARAELAAAIADLAPHRDVLASPVFLPERRVEDCVRDARPLPSSLASPLVGAWKAALDRSVEQPFADLADAEPARVVPGSLGHWEDEPAEAM